ncbi:MAG: hypothetical protein AB1410_00140 [Acidobacteriota bacterium]
MNILGELREDMDEKFSEGVYENKKVKQADDKLKDWFEKMEKTGKLSTIEESDEIFNLIGELTVAIEEASAEWGFKVGIEKGLSKLLLSFMR